MEIDEMIAVLEAYKRGEKIEYKWRGRDYDKQWHPATGLHWNFDEFDYRIAPKGPREVWVYWPEGDPFPDQNRNPTVANCAAEIGGWYKFREVSDE